MVHLPHHDCHEAVRRGLGADMGPCRSSKGKISFGQDCGTGLTVKPVLTTTPSELQIKNHKRGDFDGTVNARCCKTEYVKGRFPSLRVAVVAVALTGILPFQEMLDERGLPGAVLPQEHHHRLRVKVARRLYKQRRVILSLQTLGATTTRWSVATVGKHANSRIEPWD